MATYVLAYTGGGGMSDSKEEQDAAMAAWGAWFEGLGASVVDGGNPFGAAATIATDGSVSDGGTSQLTGYSIVTADSLTAATALAKGCPILSNGGTVEVYETVPVM